MSWGVGGSECPNSDVLLNGFRGVGAMEIVAMDMKLRGMYIARQLSFTGVTFKIEEVPLSQKYIGMYNKSVKLVSTHYFLFTVDIDWKWFIHFPNSY